MIKVYCDNLVHLLLEKFEKSLFFAGQEEIAPLKAGLANEVKNLKRDCYNNLANCLLQVIIIENFQNISKNNH